MKINNFGQGGVREMALVTKAVSGTAHGEPEPDRDNRSLPCVSHPMRPWSMRRDCGSSFLLFT
ncbi:MAG: hypothetical protein PHS17_00095 [Desulfobacterales bacterium]|nr:hypothetical protein [Desulfobacterales bacterium]